MYAGGGGVGVVKRGGKRGRSIFKKEGREEWNTQVTRKVSWEALAGVAQSLGETAEKETPWSTAGLGNSLPWMDDQDWGFLGAQKGHGI